MSRKCRWIEEAPGTWACFRVTDTGALAEEPEQMLVAMDTCVEGALLAPPLEGWKSFGHTTMEDARATTPRVSRC